MFSKLAVKILYYHYSFYEDSFLVLFFNFILKIYFIINVENELEREITNSLLLYYCDISRIVLLTC